MGGIVGVSTGIVSECINQGKIGFAHAVEVSLMVEAMLLKVVLMELTESCT